MINTCAEYCVKWLAKNHPLPEDDKPVYVYGFELLISTVSSLISILFISACINRTSYAICFFLFFFILRLFCGGYHAQTYTQCFIITNLSFIIITGITELIVIARIKWIVLIIILFTETVVWIFSPVKNENHPCSEKTNKKNKLISRIISLIYGLTLFSLFLLMDNNSISVNGAISFSWVALMILAEKIKRKGGTKNECN